MHLPGIRRLTLVALITLAAGLATAPGAFAASDITIVAGGGTSNNAGPPTFAPTGANSQVGADLIETQLDANTDVTLDTTSASADPGIITVSSAVVASGGGDLILDADSNIQFNQAIAIGPAILSATAGDPITQAAAGTLTASSASFTTNAFDNVTLDAAANDFDNLSTGLVADLAVMDTDGLTLNGITANGNATLTVGGSLIDIGPVSAGNVVLAAGSNITLDNAANSFFTVRVDSADSATITEADAMQLAGATISNDFVLSAGGSITQSMPVTVGGMTSLTAPAVNAILLSNAANDWGAVAITSAGSASVTDVNDLSFGPWSVTGTATARAGDDLMVPAGGTVTAGGALTLIADNLNPTAPAIGTGGITAGAGADLDGAGAIRLYGASRGDNSINATATFNGMAFTPGPIFVPSAREQWGVYSPGGTATAPFTFFYKDNGTPTPNPTPVVPGTVTPTPTAAEDPKCEKLRRKLKRQRRRVTQLEGTAKHLFVAHNINDTRRRLNKLDC